MILVGVGCGPDLITVQAAKIIFNAKRVAGSSKALALVEEYIQEDCKVFIIEGCFKLKEFPEDTVILSTGDPMLVGYEPKEGEIVPGISSLQVAFARLVMPIETVSVVPAVGKSFHGGSIDNIIEEAARGKNVFVLADPLFNIPDLAKRLKDRSIKCKIAVCENLGYEDERIAVGTPSRPPKPGSTLFSLVVGSW